MKKDNSICVATIAGSDSSGGAGIQADIKAISATGCYAASVITALTAQNTRGVQSIQAIAADFVEQQIKSIFDDLTISAVKIGMLHNEEVIDVVAAYMQHYKPPFIVLDPVMVSKNNCELLPFSTIHFLKEKLFPLVNLITPNVFEAEKLLDTRITNSIEQAMAAKKLSEQYQVDTLVKGGHISCEQSSDVLYLYKEACSHWFHAARIHSKNTHGTGCTLSSAIASYLAQDYPLLIAVDNAKHYLTKAIISASTRKLGSGAGPVDHFYFLGERNDI